MNEKHFHRLMGLMDSGRVVCGGTGSAETLQIAPTVLADVSPDSPVMSEEIFGPVLPVLAYESLDEAVAFVNARPKPLALYLFTTDKAAERRVLRDCSFGGGCINDTIIHLATSDMGFEAWVKAAWAVTTASSASIRSHITKALSKKSNRLDLPVRYQPYTKEKAHAAACFKIRNALYNRRPARYNVKKLPLHGKHVCPVNARCRPGSMACHRAACSKPGRGCRAREGFLRGMYMRHLIDPLDFTVEELDRLLRLGEDIRREPGAYSESCKGKKLATLFYEPSTRTRLSFEAAMLNLGGSVLGFPSANVSSVSKGESVADTIRIVSCYADIAAMRHPLEGAPMRAARFSRIPVINAGDGGHQHPTQTLTDLLTILTRRGRLSHLKIGFCGDLKYGRTVHSLVNALARYEGNEFVFISPEELRVPGHLIENVVKPAHIPYAEVTGLEEAMADLDILYMTRIQKERFTDAGEYERLKGSYVLDMPKMALGKADMAVLHPLPRVNEIALAVDDDPRAAYFEQAQNGVYVRMALILTLLGLAPSGPLAEQALSAQRAAEATGAPCRNPRCITVAEEELVPLYVPDAHGVPRCVYCEHKMP